MKIFVKYKVGKFSVHALIDYETVTDLKLHFFNVIIKTEVFKCQ